MNLYKRKKFIIKFDIDFYEKKITKCPNFKTPISAEYDKKNDLMKAYFNKVDCDKCKYSRKCIKKIFNTDYYEILIRIPIKNEYTKSFKELYYEAIKIAKKGVSTNSKELLEKAISILEQIIRNPINEYTGGSYVNISEIKFVLKQNETIKSINTDNPKIGFEEDKEMEEYYLRALEIKETNQVALSGIAKYYFSTKQYDKSIDYAKKITDYENISRYLDWVVDIDINYNLLKKYNIIKLLNFDNIISFYKELYIYFGKKNTIFKLQIGIIYSYYCTENNELLESYNILNELLNLTNDGNEEINSIFYEELAQICCPGYLNRPQEALKYYDMVKKTRDVNVKNSNKALCYIEIKEYDKAINILEKQVSNIVSNTDYFNLAKVYYIVGKYEKALENINKARYLFEDEESYILAAMINKELGNIDEAINLAKKSLYFLQNNKLDFTIEKDEIKINSFVPIRFIDEKYEKTYDKLSSCYLVAKKYEDAYVINKIALEKYPYNNKFRENIDILKQFIDMREEGLIIKRNMELLKLEKEKFKNEMGKSRKWIANLIKCQNSNQNIDDLYSSSWNDFEETLEDIMEQMKQEVKEFKVNYQDIYDDNKHKFIGISEKALTCLTTAEYLYLYNKDIFIDFAPIVVEFSRVFEIELNKTLKYEKNKTLGQILQDEFIRYSSMSSMIIDDLEQIRVIRNGAAHTGTSTIRKVEKLRNIIYETNTLKNIINFK